ncbi:MAG: hypothetical protein IJ757_00800 [Clostridiales bacterium]|nr:hypothetical protein [Clostridiales bacterium]
MSNKFDNVPAEYKPIGMWVYFGYEILFSIPVIGFILLIILAFAPKNYNVKNFARSYFCMMILVLVLTIVLVAIALATGAISSLSDITDSVGL